MKSFLRRYSIKDKSMVEWLLTYLLFMSEINMNQYYYLNKVYGKMLQENIGSFCSR